MSALEHNIPPVRTTRTSLRTVTPAQTSRSWPTGIFPLVILALLAGGMVGHLALQTAIQEQGFELASLQSTNDRLSAQEAVLRATLDKQSTPQQLAYSAAHLGMVANTRSTFLTLPTGEVTGTDTPVKGNEVPIISAAPVITVVNPTPTPTPAPAPAEVAKP